MELKGFNQRKREEFIEKQFSNRSHVMLQDIIKCKKPFIRSSELEKLDTDITGGNQGQVQTVFKENDDEVITHVGEICCDWFNSSMQPKILHGIPEISIKQEPCNEDDLDRSCNSLEIDIKPEIKTEPLETPTISLPDTPPISSIGVLEQTTNGVEISPVVPWLAPIRSESPPYLFYGNTMFLRVGNVAQNSENPSEPVNNATVKKEVKDSSVIETIQTPKNPIISDHDESLNLCLETMTKGELLEYRKRKQMEEERTAANQYALFASQKASKIKLNLDDTMTFEPNSTHNIEDAALPESYVHVKKLDMEQNAKSSTHKSSKAIRNVRPVKKKAKKVIKNKKPCRQLSSDAKIVQNPKHSIKISKDSKVSYQSKQKNRNYLPEARCSKMTKQELIEYIINEEKEEALTGANQNALIASQKSSKIETIDLSNNDSISSLDMEQNAKSSTHKSSKNVRNFRPNKKKASINKKPCGQISSHAKNVQNAKNSIKISKSSRVSYQMRNKHKDRSYLPEARCKKMTKQQIIECIINKEKEDALTSANQYALFASQKSSKVKQKIETNTAKGNKTMLDVVNDSESTQSTSGVKFSITPESIRNKTRGGGTKSTKRYRCSVSKTSTRSRRVPRKIEKATCTESSILLPKNQKANVWTCKFCFQTYSSIKEMFEHRKEHLSEENPNQIKAKKYIYDEEHEIYICNNCSAECQDLEDIEKHVESHEKKFTCYVCSENLFGPINYMVHVQKHREDKMFPCPWCQHMSQKKEAMQVHINRLHLHIYDFQCTTCGKGFNDALSFKEHNNVHLNLKSFGCVVCSKHFYYSRYLLSHQLRTHTVRILDPESGDDTDTEETCNILEKTDTVTANEYSPNLKTNVVANSPEIVYYISSD